MAAGVKQVSARGTLKRRAWHYRPALRTVCLAVFPDFWKLGSLRITETRKRGLRLLSAGWAIKIERTAVPKRPAVARSIYGDDCSATPPFDSRGFDIEPTMHQGSTTLSKPIVVARESGHAPVGGGPQAVPQSRKASRHTDHPQTAGRRHGEKQAAGRRHAP